VGKSFLKRKKGERFGRAFNLSAADFFAPLLRVFGGHTGVFNDPRALYTDTIISGKDNPIFC